MKENTSFCGLRLGEIGYHGINNNRKFMTKDYFNL